MSRPPIFVSYSRQDADFALRLGRDLRAAGVNLWIDQLDIPPGGRWDREVERALKASRMLVVVLSPEAVASENVMDEVGYALSESKRVVPVMSRPCELPLRLQRVQYVDLSSDYGRGLERLVATLGGSEVEPQAAADESRPRVAPAAAAPLPVSGWKPLVGMAVLAGLVVGGGLLWMALSPGRIAPTPDAAATRETRSGGGVPPATTRQLPDLMTRPLTEAELAGKSVQDLDLMRNEIYARHGRRFARADLQAYFDSQPWYRPLYAPDEFPTSLLTPIQKRNVDLIQRVQQRSAAKD
jgi:hypothetical protein